MLGLLTAVAACGSDGPTGPGTPPPSIVTSELPEAYEEEVYSAGVDAEGGTGSYTWEVVTGQLPPGIVLSLEDLSDDDLVITGTPERQGLYRFTLEVRSGEAQSDTATFSIDVQPPLDPLLIETVALVPALEGHPYTVEMQATGAFGTYSWSIAEGSLPAGLSLSSSGVFSGSPVGSGDIPLTVQVTSGTKVTQEEFVLRVNPDDTDAFNITAFPVTPVPSALLDNVEEAVRRWEAAISGDLERRDVAEGSNILPCRGFQELADGTSIDDAMMMINIDTIDGPGAVLGSAGPCYLRPTDGLPYLGVLTLDQDDLLAYQSEETITDIIQHEMGHILGIGPLWDPLLEGSGTGDPRFTGENAVTAYHAAGGTEETIPVEGTGGQGTAEAHWREADNGVPVFDSELMTGYIEPQGVDNYLSAMTIGSLADLGYSVDYAAAEQKPLLLRSDRLAPGRSLGHDMAATWPIYAVNPDGSVAYTITPPTSRR